MRNRFPKGEERKDEEKKKCIQKKNIRINNDCHFPNLNQEFQWTLRKE